MIQITIIYLRKIANLSCLLRPLPVKQTWMYYLCMKTLNNKTIETVGYL